jgi:hypothetical protein
LLADLCELLHAVVQLLPLLISLQRALLQLIHCLEGQLPWLQCVLVLLLLLIERSMPGRCFACWRERLWCDDMKQQVYPAGAVQDLIHIKQLHTPNRS